MIGLPDLHRHLDGSLRLATVLELAAGKGVAAPQPLAFQPGMGLQAALSRFAFTLSLLETGRDYPCEVTRLAAKIDPVSQTVRVTGRIVGKADDLLPGMSGRASFPSQR